MTGDDHGYMGLGIAPMFRMDSVMAGFVFQAARRDLLLITFIEITN
jgi:hypothetical protein